MPDNINYKALDPDVLKKSLAHFARPKGSNIIERTRGFFDWQDSRRQANVWPYSRSLDSAPGPLTRTRNELGIPMEGINFASQDYLSLASHPDITAAATRALEVFGPHSAGSPGLLGNTSASLQLEQSLSEALQSEHVTLFPTGWAAGFGTITGLVRPDDYIVMDRLSHACLQQGARSATPNVMVHKHLGMDEVRSNLREIRAKNTSSGILVITEGLFSMDSDTPPLQEMQELCNEFEATLMVDVAHDFGSLGPEGTGHIGIQGMLGKIDLVMGSFSKTFASNGGFLASRSHAVKQIIKSYSGPQVFSNAISPVQASIVNEALRIVRSGEGDTLRDALMAVVTHTRNEFRTMGINCLGDPSAIIPVPIGDEAVARISSALCSDSGVLVNLVEFPAVSVGAARFRMQAMAGHTREQASQAASIIRQCIDEAEAIVAAMG